MGQYHYIVNLDKHEFLNPYQLGTGLKLWEQLANTPGTTGALLILLAASNGRGGGDFETGRNQYNAGKGIDDWDWHDEETEDSSLREQWIGRWAGDRIACIGDYAKPGDLDRSKLYKSVQSRGVGPETLALYCNDHPESIYDRCVTGPPEPCTADPDEHHPWNHDCIPDTCECSHEHAQRDHWTDTGLPMFTNITPFVRFILEQELNIKFVPPSYAADRPGGGWDSWLDKIDWNWFTNEPAPQKANA